MTVQLRALAHLTWSLARRRWSREIGSASSTAPFPARAPEGTRGHTVRSIRHQRCFSSGRTCHGERLPCATVAARSPRLPNTPPGSAAFASQLFYTFFKTLIGKEVVVEMKNDVSIRGKLHSVDQYLNFKLEATTVEQAAKFPQLVSRAAPVQHR